MNSSKPIVGKRQQATEEQRPSPSVRHRISDEAFDALTAVHCENPKAEDVQQLRKMLRENPTLWEIAGNLMLQAEEQAIQAVDWGKSKSVVTESIRDGIKRVRHDLGYDMAPMLERLLIEQCVLAWVRLSICETKYSNYVTGKTSIVLADFWDRTLNASQRRFMRAMETLARVRRLKLPAMQMNIAQAGAHQMNVAASGGKTSSDPFAEKQQAKLASGDMG